MQRYMMIHILFIRGVLELLPASSPAFWGLRCFPQRELVSFHVLVSLVFAWVFCLTQLTEEGGTEAF